MQTRRFLTTVAFNFVAAAHLAAQTQTYPAKPGDPVPPSREVLNQISNRGRLLWQYDAIASIASDSIIARKPDAKRIGGYVARQSGDRWTVAFGYTSVTADTFFVTYEARQRANDPEVVDITAFTTPRADTGYYYRAFNAMGLARMDFGEQGRPYNAAVLESPRDHTLWVYLMPAQLRRGVYPSGNDIRYIFATDGKTIQEKRKLHNTIIEFSAPAKTASGELKATTHTAVVGNLPEDTDVFHVLAREPSVADFVITDTYVFFITTDGGIGVLGPTRELVKDGKSVAP
jgi:hypothetical protein